MKDREISTSSGTPATSVLTKILGASHISRLERVRRSTRLRELAGGLGALVPEMSTTQRQSFSELLGLIRAEHTEACESQLKHVEGLNAALTQADILRELQKLQVANENMQAIALRIQTNKAQSIRTPLRKAFRSMLVRITHWSSSSNKKRVTHVGTDGFH